MAERRLDPLLSVVVKSGQPLIAVPFEEGGREVVRSCVDENADEDAGSGGSNLGWDEMEAALRRMRDEVPPSPPIDDP